MHVFLSNSPWSFTHVFLSNSPWSFTHVFFQTLLTFSWSFCYHAETKQQVYALSEPNMHCLNQICIFWTKYAFSEPNMHFLNQICIFWTKSAFSEANMHCLHFQQVMLATHFQQATFVTHFQQATQTRTLYCSSTIFPRWLSQTLSNLRTTYVDTAVVTPPINTDFATR